MAEVKITCPNCFKGDQCFEETAMDFKSYMCFNCGFTSNSTYKNDTETLELFSHLIKNGMAWTLQGHYGRTASHLIDNDYINRDGKITGSDFEMLKMNKKKYGGKISYRMKGGQVVDSSYD